MGSSPGNSSAITVKGGPGRLPDAQGQVAGRAAHGHHQVPPPGGDGVGHQVVDELDPHAPGGLEAEGRHAARQRQVVVDGLRHVRHTQAPAGRLGQPGRRERGVVPADRHERADPQLPQRLQAGVQPPVRVGGALVPHRRVGPRGPDDRPAQDVDPRHVRDGQRPRLLDPALDQVLEAVHDPQHVPPGVPGLDRGRGDDRVHPRAGPPPHRIPSFTPPSSQQPGDPDKQAGPDPGTIPTTSPGGATRHGPPSVYLAGAHAHAITCGSQRSKRAAAVTHDRRCQRSATGISAGQGE